MEPELEYRSPAEVDMAQRWLPSPGQRRVAQAMIAAAVADGAGEARDFVVTVGLALPGKTCGFWEVGQPVELAGTGFWLASRRGDTVRAARDAAEDAAAAQLGDRPGCVSYAYIYADGHASVFEGLCPVRDTTETTAETIAEVTP